MCGEFSRKRETVPLHRRLSQSPLLACGILGHTRPEGVNW